MLIEIFEHNIENKKIMPLKCKIKFKYENKETIIHQRPNDWDVNNNN